MCVICLLWRYEAVIKVLWDMVKGDECVVFPYQEAGISSL